MLDLKKISVSRLPQATKFFECPNGYFLIDELWTITAYQYRKPDQDKLDELRNSIDELERQHDEFGELIGEIRKLESEYNFESQNERKISYKCNWLTTQSKIENWLDYARDAKQNSIWSIMYATWRRSQDAEIDPDEVLPKDRERVYTWTKRA